MRTRRGRRRTAGARYLGVGAEATAGTSLPPTTSDETVEEETVEEKEAAARAIAATLAEPGWGITYAPPRTVERDRGW